MIPTPPGSTQSELSVSGRDAGAMIDWLCTAFGLVVRLRADDGETAMPGSVAMLVGMGLHAVLTRRRTAARA